VILLRKTALPGVDIPTNFSLLNQASMYDEYDIQSNVYNNVLALKQGAVMY